MIQMQQSRPNEFLVRNNTKAKRIHDLELEYSEEIKAKIEHLKSDKLAKFGIYELIEFTCKNLDISVNEYFIPTRYTEPTKARQIVAAIIYKRYSWRFSQVKIGELIAISGRSFDHTTIIHCRKQIKNWRDTNDQFFRYYLESLEFHTEHFKDYEMSKCNNVFYFDVDKFQTLDSKFKNLSLTVFPDLSGYVKRDKKVFIEFSNHTDLNNEMDNLL